VQASFSDIAFTPATDSSRPLLTFQLNRTGNSSIYGDLSATYFAPESNEGLLIGEVNQLAVYTPNSHRIVTMQLFPPKGIELQSGGRIAIAFSYPPKEGGGAMAAAEYQLD
jgi:hypothetical protein